MHQTTMAPTKLELLAAWLPAQPWFVGDASALASLGGYRFDDPEGEVGLEGILLTAGDSAVYHVPLTYRGAPLDGGDDFLLGTSEHGVLGRRWVSDAAGDPVYRSVLAAVIAQGGTQAAEEVEAADGNRTPREPKVRVSGSGRPGAEVPEFWAASVEPAVSGFTRVETGFAVLDIVRVLDGALRARQDQLALGATWEGQPEETILALMY